MAGVKGAGGPVPKRADKRLGHRSKDEKRVEHAEAGEVIVPKADDDWHPIALRWFESLKLSGQSSFYTSADWMTAFTIAESMSREFKPQPLVVGQGPSARVEMHELPPKASALTAWLKGMTGLLVMEGDRRRAGLELERAEPVEETNEVAELDAYRDRLSG